MAAPLIHRDIEQHSPEWYAIKAGRFSASKAATIMGGLDTSGLDSLIKDLAWERVFGALEGGFKSAAMERGNELEPSSRDWFASERGVDVQQVGFVIHADLPMVGWSPDGLFDNDRRAVEAKCPLHKAWMEVKRTGKVPAEYRWQCRWAQWTGQLDGLDFVAWHPQAGGLVIPCEVTPTECEQMAERVALLEPRVKAWVELIGNRKEERRAMDSPIYAAIADPEISF